jgi:hypothetical protein
MSTIKSPVGPEPRKVYWRRRIIVLIGLVAVIAIVVLIFVRPGAGTPEGPLDEAVAATKTPTPTPTPTATPQPGAVDVPTPPTDSKDVAECGPSDIVVTPVTDADTYAAAVIPQLSFSIKNESAKPCSLNVGTTKQVYTVTSGDETYWTSTDCQSNATDTPAIIDAGATLTSTPFPWDRTRSAPDTCTAPDRPQVPAAGASYHLAVSVGGFDSADTAQFILN